MDKKEIKKLLGDKNFEEISFDEWCEMNDEGKMSVFCSDGKLYFKPKEQWPKVFESYDRKIEVARNGDIETYDRFSKETMPFCDSLPILYKAVELSKKQRNN